MPHASAEQLAQAARLEAAAIELDSAAAHARLAAEHFRAAEVPRGAAHGLAVLGHLVAVQAVLDEVALRHARKARTTP